MGVKKKEEVLKINAFELSDWLKRVIQAAKNGGYDVSEINIKFYYERVEASFDNETYIMSER